MELHISAEIINLIMLFVVIFSIIDGYRNGFLLKIASLCGIIVLGILSWSIAPMISEVIHLFPKSLLSFTDNSINLLFYNQMNTFLIFLVLWVLMNLLILLIKPILKFFNVVPIISGMNRFIGSIFGAFEGIVLLLITILFLQTPFISNGQQLIEQSYLKELEPYSSTVVFFAKESFEQIKTLQQIQIEDAIKMEDIIKIKEWLLNQGISEEKVENLIQTLS